MGGVDDYRLGLPIEHLFERFFFDLEVRLLHSDVPAFCARENRIRAIILVEGLENHDLLSTIEECKLGSDHTLSCSAHDRYLVHTAVNVVVCFHLTRDRFPQTNGPVS